MSQNRGFMWTLCRSLQFRSATLDTVPCVAVAKIGKPALVLHFLASRWREYFAMLTKSEKWVAMRTPRVTRFKDKTTSLQSKSAETNEHTIGPTWWLSFNFNFHNKDLCLQFRFRLSTLVVAGAKKSSTPYGGMSVRSQLGHRATAGSLSTKTFWHRLHQNCFVMTIPLLSLA